MITLFIAALASFPALFLAWILVTGFQRAEYTGTLKPSVRAFGYIIFVLGYACDIWCNLVCTLVFLDLPREFTVSQRLRRLVKSTSTWRRALAIWFADTLINPFSVGGPHIITSA